MAGLPQQVLGRSMQNTHTMNGACPRLCDLAALFPEYLALWTMTLEIKRWWVQLATKVTGAGV